MPATSSEPPGAAPRVLKTLLPLRVGQGLGTFVVGLGNPKMRLPALGDRVTFSPRLTRLGRPSPGKAWVLSEVSLRLLIGGVGSTARHQFGLTLEA